jgi:hypothetical protein
MPTAPRGGAPAPPTGPPEGPGHRHRHPVRGGGRSKTLRREALGEHVGHTFATRGLGGIDGGLFADGHPGREARADPETQTEGFDFPIRRGPRRRARLEVFHLLAREELHHRGVFGAEGNGRHHEARHEGPVGAATLDQQVPAVGGELDSHAHGRPREQIGHMGRRVLHERRAREREPHDQRLARVRDQATHQRLHVFARRDDGLESAPRARRGRGERAVHRAAHAHGVDTRAEGQRLQDRRDDLAFEADQPVGHEHHLALALRAQRTQRFEDPFAHLGATRGSQSTQPGARGGLGGLGRGLAGGAKATRRRGELDQLEAISLAQRVDDREGRAARLFERRARHGAAGVEQHDDIARRREGARSGPRRRQREQPEGLVFPGDPQRVQHQRGGRRGHRPAQHEVPIEGRVGGERHEGGSVLRAHDERVRRGRGHASERERVTDREGERETRVDRPGGEILRHERGVRHAARLAEVTGGRRRGETQLPAFVEPRQALIQQHLDEHVRTRRHVAELLREQAAALLLEQPCGPALDQRVLVALASRGAAIDLAHDAPRADGDREARHGRVGRQRQAVADRERQRVDVAEALREREAREAPSRLGGEVGRHQRQSAPLGRDGAGAMGSRGGGHGGDGQHRRTSGSRRVAPSKGQRGGAAAGDKQKNSAD